ncbi:MAG TPA: NCS2 family permease [Candidatus Limnocylindria bacterium]|nr:NCS2 family permease [Candidatus Limnocylindria bacterium]
MEADATEVPRSDSARAAPQGGLDSFFKLSERGTTVGTEVKAGITTFLVMAYIIFLNPNILSGMFPQGSAEADAFRPAASAATALLAGLLTIAMGVFANVPIALAAGLGINAIVAFFLVGVLGLTPAGAMGVIVIEGLVVLALVLVGLREAIMNAVPLSLKRAIGVGIGLFILFIGFVDGGLIGQGGAIIEFKFPNEVGPWLTLLGLVVTIVLWVRKVPAALLISILIMSVIALIVGHTSVPERMSFLPDFSTIGDFDLGNVWSLGALTAVLTIFSIMLTDFFDTMGTATAIGEQAGLTDEDGNVPGIGRILLVDSVGAVAGGAAGISSNTSYIESAAGVAEGGRTGLTSVVTGLLFLVAVFVTPLAGLVPFTATAPVLILVGYLMATLIKDIQFDDVEEGLPALFGIVLMPLTFSITVGIGAAFITWVLVKVVRGKLADVHPLMWIVALAFVVYFAQNWLGSVL